jgi:hypothetical protein
VQEREDAAPLSSEAEAATNMRATGPAAGDNDIAAGVDTATTTTGRMSHDRTRSELSLPQIKQEWAEEQVRQAEEKARMEAGKPQATRARGQPPLIAATEEGQEGQGQQEMAPSQRQ